MGVVLLDMEALRSAVADALSGRQDEVAGATRIVRTRSSVTGSPRGPATPRPWCRRSGPGSRTPAGVEFDRQRSKRSELSDAQWDQVDAVTRAMVAKLLHQPTVALKDAAGTPRGERLVEALRTLFDL